MKIPQETINEYNIDIEQSEELIYREFLSRTDYISNKIIENLIENLASATLADFISIFIKFIVEIRVEYKEVLQYRKIAREEIDKILSEK